MRCRHWRSRRRGLTRVPPWATHGEQGDEDMATSAEEAEGTVAQARAEALARVVLRPIAAADDPVLARIVREVMTEHGAIGPGFAIVDPEIDELSVAYAPDREPPAEYWVLEDGGEVLGGGGFGALAGGDGSTCELRKMYLLARARGGGLGRRLLEHLLARMAERGYRRCYLETLGTMHKARALYLAAGFEKLCAPEGATGHFGCDAWYARTL
jgi:putative acetyltransferase